MKALMRWQAWVVAAAVVCGCSEETVDLSIDSGSSSSGAPPTFVPADGVTITSIAAYQGVKRPLMEAGVASGTTIPVVSGRGALIRVFYSVDGNYNGQPVIARFTIADQPPLEVVGTVAGSSTDDLLSSTLNFQLPGLSLLQSTNYRVDIVQSDKISSGDNASATYPIGGQQEVLPVQSSGAALKIALVPIQYFGDGSGRLPDTSEAQLQLYSDAFFKMMPVPAIELTVHEPISYNTVLTAGGDGWAGMLDMLTEYRSSSGTPDDVYLYGIVAPAGSYGEYCGMGCLAGLSNFAGPSDAWLRAGVGVGFFGVAATETAIHEVGHEHGRNHAPCGTSSGLDEAFPHSMGEIGTWGYDLVTGELWPPNNTRDVMSYCNPVWVSDYNFKALFARIKLVNLAHYQLPEGPADVPYERWSLAASTLERRSPLTLPHPPNGLAVEVLVTRDGGSDEVQADFFPYTHVDGGTIVFPAGVSPAESLQILSPL